MDLYNNRPGPLNEHDYYSTRETNDAPLSTPNGKHVQEEIIPSESLQVIFTTCIVLLLHCIICDPEYVLL